MISLDQVSYQIISTAVLLWLAWYFNLKQNIGLSILMIAVQIGFGLSYLAQGIGDLSSAGSANALLIFESGKKSMDQAAFDTLHATLDPTSASGFLHVNLGSFMIVAGLGFGLYLVLLQLRHSTSK